MEPMDSSEMSKLFGNFYDHQNFTLDDSSPRESSAEPSEKSDSAGIRKRRLVKKCPDAPKRFKSAYICFVTERMDDVKKGLSSDIKVTEVMKVLAGIWKTLPPLERIRYEKIADADKARYFEEMNVYEGPMQVPNKRQKKPAGAPKRGMSAFLSFSQQMRPQVRAMFPDLKNTDISTILAQRWHAAHEEEKRPHLDRELRDREKYHVDMAKWKLEEKEQHTVASSDQQYSNYLPTQQQHVTQQQFAQQQQHQQQQQQQNMQNSMTQNMTQNLSIPPKKSPRTQATNINSNTTAPTNNTSQISQTFTNQHGSGAFTENEMKTKMTLDFLDLNSWDEAHAQYGVTGNGDLLYALMSQQQQAQQQAQVQEQHHHQSTSSHQMMMMQQQQQAQMQAQQGNTNNNKTNDANADHKKRGRSSQQGLPSLEQMNQFLHGNEAEQQDGEGTTLAVADGDTEEEDENNSDHNGSNIDSSDSDTNRFWDEALNHLSHNSNSPDAPASPQHANTTNEESRNTTNTTTSAAAAAAAAAKASASNVKEETRFHPLPAHLREQQQASQNQGGQSYYPANITAAAFAANNQQNQQQSYYPLGPLFEKPSPLNTSQVILPLPRGSVRTHEQQQQHQQLLWQQMTAMAAKGNPNSVKSNHIKNTAISSNSAQASNAGGVLSLESSKALAAASAALKSRKSMLASATASNAAASAAVPAKKINASSKASSSSASSSSLLPIELAALSAASSNGGRQGFYMSNISKLQQILDQSGFCALYDRFHTGNTPSTSPAHATITAAAAAGGRRSVAQQEQDIREAEELADEIEMLHGAYPQPSYVDDNEEEEA